MEYSWINSLNEKVEKYIVETTNNYFKFPYSMTGDLEKNYNKWGLANIVFTVRSLYVIDKIAGLDTETINQIYEKIMFYNRKFGAIYDEMITGGSLLERVKKVFDKNCKSRVRLIQRAETRQAFSSLLLLNKKPENAYTLIPYLKEDVDSFFSSFDWSRPWHAGSHINHFLFFNWFNANVLKVNHVESVRNNKSVFNKLDAIQSQDDGCWYIGNNVPLYEKINGAMKIINGYHSADELNIPFPKKIIDTALLAKDYEDACNNFNVVYVLYGVKKLEPEYRKNEIEDYLLTKLRRYKEFYYDSYGAFSFNINSSNNTLYGKKITKGLREPDIHGTAMFLWGIALINNVLKLGFNMRIPKN